MFLNLLIPSILIFFSTKIIQVFFNQSFFKSTFLSNNIIMLYYYLILKFDIFLFGNFFFLFLIFLFLFIFFFKKKNKSEYKRNIIFYIKYSYRTFFF